MASSNRPALLAVLFFLFFKILLFAQVKIHKNLNIEDGMVYSQVLSIIEDHSGYMWFGTSSGISRWDGLSFKNFIFPEGLSDNNCKWIAESPDSMLFIATRKGIVSYRNGQFNSIPNQPPALRHWIHSMMISEKGKLFIATDTSGLWIYDGSNFDNINSSDGLDGNCARALGCGKNGLMYVADKAGSIYAYEKGGLNPCDVPALPDGIEITALFEDNNGILWIGTNRNGLFINFKGNLLHFSNPDGMPSENITFLSRGDSNQVFVSTDNGLVLFENYHLKSVLNKENGLSNNFIWQVYRDHNGLFYIGTDGGGVDIYRPGLFETINTDCGLPNNTVWTICETAEHDFYLGTDEGLAIYSKNSIQILNTATGLTSNMILTVHEGSDGTVYIGTNESGVDIIRNGKIKNLNTAQGLDGPSVWTIAEDPDGLIYFGTYDGGINIWDGSNIIDTLNTADGLPTNAVISSYRCAHGHLYFGTDGGGVYRINQGKIDSLLLPGNTVWTILEDENEEIYFGTNDNGMIYTRGGKWDTLSVEDGLSHNSILGILKDDYGKFYLSADNGLNIIEFTDDGPLIRLLGRRDGLASSECNQGAFLKDSQGFLWFGTVHGVSRYNPSLAKPNKIAPLVHFTRFQVFDTEFPIDKSTKNMLFNYNENYMKFEFIGIDLLAPHKVKYKYRLSSVDQEWVETDRPYVQYTSLNDNDYTFEVTAGNDWGYWSQPVKLTFTIKPPFWETWWFILLSVIVVVSPIIVVVRQRINRVLAVERLRAKIAADLHDDIGAGLSEINILSAVVAAKAPAEVIATCEHELNKIGQTARNLIDSMSDIVWLVNPKKDAVSDLISRLSDSFSDVFAAKGIQFHCENADALQQVRLDMEYRQNLFMILKEAIHNSVKYSEADKLELNVNLNGKEFCISVKDNGKGFDPDKESSGNGLNNMQYRARKIKGSVLLQSQNGSGTIVTFQGRLR